MNLDTSKKITLFIFNICYSFSEVVMILNCMVCKKENLLPFLIDNSTFPNWALRGTGSASPVQIRPNLKKLSLFLNKFFYVITY